MTFIITKEKNHSFIRWKKSVKVGTKVRVVDVSIVPKEKLIFVDYTNNLIVIHVQYAWKM